MKIYNKHYIRLDEENNIIYGFSDAIHSPQDNDILITEQGGTQFKFEFTIDNPDLQNLNGIYLYKYINNQIVAKTPEEIQFEINTIELIKPIQTVTADEAMAMACYVGMMTGVL